MSSEMLSRWSVNGWEVCLQKWQLSNLTDQMYGGFPCFHLPFVFSVSELFGQSEGKEKAWKWE